MSSHSPVLRQRGLKMNKRLIGLLFFIAASCVAIVVAGGGVTFFQHPVGATYLTLWVVWWVVLSLGRQRGVPSTYDRKQRAIVAIGAIALLVVIVASPWEYARFVGPIPRNGPLAWAGLVLFAAGVVLQAAAMWSIRGLYTSRLGVQPGHRLVTSGPYRVVRHPGYLSNLMCMTGIGWALSSLVALGSTVLVVPLILWRIEREEEMLVAEFGQRYQNYMQQTKWRLIPLVC
jgi:protein-S-isoprenylcysteine O-methyltransferase Ste14